MAPKNPFVADKKGGMQSRARGRRNFTLLLPFSRGSCGGMRKFRLRRRAAQQQQSRLETREVLFAAYL
jgi:hypothetical protein